MTEPVRDKFISAMRRLTSTVTIISAGKSGEESDGRHGMTATAVTSVSMDPPSLLVCVNRGGRLHDLISSCEHFCVNVLHADQHDVSQVFSKAHSLERFSHGEWLEDERGTPYLRGAQAAIFCRQTMLVPYGSHSVVIGDVEDVKVRDEIAPLLYQNGSYGIYGPLLRAS